MAEFFAGACPARPGLALFLNAGDPPLDVLADVVRMLDERGVDCLELAVPFTDSVTDGPVIRRSADRALAADVGLDDVLGFVAAVRGGLRTLRIVLLADWGHTVRPLRHEDFVHRVAGSGADAVLVHGLPPRLGARHRQASTEAGLPVVTTCYPTSDPAVRARAAKHASAYLYLVAGYGRSGRRPPAGYAGLRPIVAQLRAATSAPIAVGFGVRSRADIAALAGLGADAAVVGSAGVAVVADALDAGRDVTAALSRFVQELRGIQPKQEIQT